jgi:hypothetical protein
MAHRALLALSLALASITVAAPPAAATIVKSLSLDEMVKSADVVVHGRVERRVASWNEERTRIYTVSEIRVEESLKGPARAGEVLRVRQLGGEVDGIAQTIAGNAKLAEGEEVILFLDRDEEKGLHYVVGMAQGKYAVDRKGAQPTVVRTLDGLSMADVEQGQVRGLRHAPAVQAPPALDVFKAQIRAAQQPRP